ncbi:MAG: hypothetical protein AAF433_13775 [Bacteroidota bacterium]
MRNVFYLLCLVFWLSCHSIERDLAVLKNADQLESAYLGIVGSPSKTYAAFDRLKEKLSIDDWLELSRDTNTVTRGYAGWALIDLEYPRLEEVYEEFLQNDGFVSTMSGCIMMGTTLSSELFWKLKGCARSPDYPLAAFCHDKLQEITAVNIRNLSLLDSFRINSAFQITEADPEYYEAIRTFVLDQTHEYAIISLAKYQREEDLELILNSQKYQFAAIEQFQHPRLWAYLEGIQDSVYTLGFNRLPYFFSVASFPTEAAEKLMEEQSVEAIQRGDTRVIGAIQQAINKYPRLEYLRIVERFWTEAATINLTNFNYLRQQRRGVKTNCGRGLA